MDVVALIGRIVFALLFLAAGFGHLTQTAAMAEVAKARGFPAARLGVQVTGVYIVLAALLIMFGVWVDVAALALVLFLLVTAFGIHRFWQETDAGAKAGEQVHFLKDLALAGAALVLFVLYSGDGAGLVLVGPLLNLGG